MKRKPWPGKVAGANSRGMERHPDPFHHCRPGAALSGFVDFLWSYEGYGPPHARERLLPSGRMELVFTLDAGGRAAGWLAGPRSEFVVLDTSRPFSAIGVHFRPGGGFPFFAAPSCELHNCGVTLDQVWGGFAASVRDRLWEADTPARRFGILEDALLDRARGWAGGHPAVRYAVDAFERSKGARLVSDVVGQIGISSRRFADVFRSEVGLSPKLFCRVRRFNEVLRWIEQQTDVDWVSVALSCGYYDQAHFNHDFHTFSGISPSNYLRHRTARMHVATAD
jgi:AraC-like DNA-binding protein